MTLIPATDGSRKTWAHRGETVDNAVDALKVLHDIDAINRRGSEDLGASRRDRGVGTQAHHDLSFCDFFDNLIV